MIPVSGGWPLTRDPRRVHHPQDVCGAFAVTDGPRTHIEEFVAVQKRLRHRASCQTARDGQRPQECAIRHSSSPSRTAQALSRSAIRRPSYLAAPKAESFPRVYRTGPCAVINAAVKQCGQIRHGRSGKGIRAKARTGAGCIRLGSAAVRFQQQRSNKAPFECSRCSDRALAISSIAKGDDYIALFMGKKAPFQWSFSRYR